FFAMYIWFILFNILALHQIIISFVVGLLTILFDVLLFISLKKQYYDTFDFGRNITIFIIFYLFQSFYFLKAWLGISSQKLILGYLIGYSQLKMTGILAVLIKSVGSIALLLSLISIFKFSKSGFVKIIPGWDDYITVSENLFLSYIVTTIHVIGSLIISSYIMTAKIHIIILFIMLLIASFMIIPIYLMKFKKMAIYSPETIKMLRMIKNKNAVLIIDLVSLLVSSCCLIIFGIFGGPWVIGTVILSLFVLINNRVLQIGIIVREQREEEIENITSKLFGFS
ncbi:MAG: hypothetical protein ACTSPI_10985, partial [Candidatus Heimdallarchaeaceae archaeon]